MLSLHSMSLGSRLQVQMTVAVLRSSQPVLFSISAFIWTRSEMIADQLPCIKSARSRRKHISTDQPPMIWKLFSFLYHPWCLLILVGDGEGGFWNLRWISWMLKSEPNWWKESLGYSCRAETLTALLCGFGAALCRCGNTSNTCSKMNDCGLNSFSFN